MKTAFIYTVLDDDTLSGIASKISACAGVTVSEIQSVNNQLNSLILEVGQIIFIPASINIKIHLEYTVRQGDTLQALADALSDCSGLTYQQIVQNNKQIDANSIHVGQLINIPYTPSSYSSDVAESSTTQTVDNVGYWHWTWSQGTPPSTTNLSIAFSGWTDITTAIQQSDHIKNELQGKKYICLGGGNENGAFTQEGVLAATHAISAGTFDEYSGIALDVEEGDSGLTQSFSVLFRTAQQCGFKVLVTVSHSAPYGIKDGAELMHSFINNSDIDLLSPQLYKTGFEVENDFTTSQGVDWKDYRDTKAALVPSIVKASMYDSAQKYFEDIDVELHGYIQWSQN